MERKCPCCHRQVADNMRFCNYCGARIAPVIEEEDFLVCPRCNTTNALLANYCKACGTKLIKRQPKNPYVDLQTEFDRFINDEVTKFEDESSRSLTSALESANNVISRIDSKVDAVIKTVSSDKQSPFAVGLLEHIYRARMDSATIIMGICEHESFQ